jgi:hypothetical protein
MVMRSLNCVFIIVCFSFILITTIPIVILSDTLLPFDSSIYSNSYESYHDPSLVEKININVDFGNIEIIYITQPIDYSVKVELSIEMSGYNLKGKHVLDFFEVDWQETSSTLNFSLFAKEADNLINILSLLRELQIKVMLRASIECNFKINIQNGNLVIYVPFGASIGNVFANVSTGNIQYDFAYCNIDGNITGIVSDGTISFKTNHIQFSKNIILTFINNHGETLIDIFQNCKMGANITGIGKTETGLIKLFYKDNSTEIGAQFILNNKRDLGNEAINNAIGFHNEGLPDFGGQLFYSYDYPSINNYNISLYKPYPSDMGDYIWDISSNIPI